MFPRSIKHVFNHNPRTKTACTYQYAHYTSMTTVIRQNKDWLVQQISEAVDYVIETQLDAVKQFLTRSMMEQLYFSGYIEHSGNETDKPGKLVIEIDLPNSEECDKALDKMESFTESMLAWQKAMS